MQEYIELSLVKQVQLKIHFLRLLTAICFPKIFARIVKNMIIHLLAVQPGSAGAFNQSSISGYYLSNQFITIEGPLNWAEPCEAQTSLSYLPTTVVRLRLPQPSLAWDWLAGLAIMNHYHYRMAPAKNTFCPVCFPILFFKLVSICISRVCPKYNTWMNTKLNY